MNICIRSMRIWMDGRMDGWMDGWTDGRMDGWTDGRMDARMYVCMHACMYVCIYVCMQGCIEFDLFMLCMKNMHVRKQRSVVPKRLCATIRIPCPLV